MKDLAFRITALTAALLLMQTACASPTLPALVPTPTVQSRPSGQTPRAMVPLAREIASGVAPSNEPLVTDDEAYPCHAGQIKANRDLGTYLTSDQRDYAKTQTNVQCFDSAPAAETAGFRKTSR